MEEKGKNLALAESRDAIDLVPSWEFQLWWVLAAGAVIAVIVFLLVMVLRKKPVVDASKEKREAYREAKVALSECESVDPHESTLRVSMILRRYLARSMNEPALFETHEEFIARHDGLKNLPEDLKSELGAFFSKLASVKYAPGDFATVDGRSIYTEASALLERSHRA